MRLGHGRFLSLAALAAVSVSAVDTTVNLTYATYEGNALGNGITEWLGMRYAAPPLRQYRFAPPQEPRQENSTQQASQNKPVCLSNGSVPSDSQDEDCLFISVYAPSNATSQSKLPVYFFIQGGGFNSNGNPNLNGSSLMTAGNNSFVFVTFNYRVSLWGFLAFEYNTTRPGGTSQQIKIANNGLLDQRKALQWVRRHISNFGGDPDHVVLGGDSAGAASVALHMQAYGGNATDPEGSGGQLFHGGAAESVSFAPVLTIEETKYQLGNLSQQMNCTSAGKGGNTAGLIMCLRNKSAADLGATAKNVPYWNTVGAPLYMWSPVLDGDFVRELPCTAFRSGRFAHVPLIAGAVSNDGRSFAPEGTATLNESNTWLKQQFPWLTQSQLNMLNSLYPNPDGNYSCSGTSGCYFHQLAQVYGEMRYMCSGLYINTALAKAGFKNSYAFRWDVHDPSQDGVLHVAEVNAIFGLSDLSSYAPGGSNYEATRRIQAYWASFIRTLDPNAYKLGESAEWEGWNNGTMKRMWFQTGGNTTMEELDKNLSERCLYLWEIGEDNHQ